MSPSVSWAGREFMWTKAPDVKRTREVLKDSSAAVAGAAASAAAG